MNNLKCLIADACENLNKKDINDEIDSKLQLWQIAKKVVSLNLFIN